MCRLYHYSYQYCKNNYHTMTTIIITPIIYSVSASFIFIVITIITIVNIIIVIIISIINSHESLVFVANIKTFI